ncbi:Pr6Pr family membrane protein [Marmoricola sp. RAF53]|uniref:Pr6Pr family membrane protein n=1 Tax=Marmoricola sp. RAF53 TaxID=3233059 RepID=UPI003F9A54C2
MTRARWFHLVTFLVATFAVALQLVLVWQGHVVLDETNRPDRGTRLVRFASYLTIWSNVLVAWSTGTLAFGRDRDTRVWRALRLDAVVICFGGGLVHFFFLRPLLDLHGADLLADRLLHVVVPLLAVAGWLVLGPRGRATAADVGPFLVLPLVWLAYTLVRGAFAGWYPYPFLDVDEHGYLVVALNCVLVAALMLALALGAVALDRRLAQRAHGDPART